MPKVHSYDPSQVVAKLGHRSPPQYFDPVLMATSYLAHADHATQDHYPSEGTSVPPDVRSAHKKKYNCSICGRGFTTSGHLARHTRIHTGERNHTCPFPGCETRCSRQDNLQQHYRIHLSPGSRRTTGKATRDAMNRAMEEYKRNASAQRDTQSAVTQSQLTRSPTAEASYGRPSPPSARYPSPPDEPPRLECAYGTRTAESVSSQSSARSSPSLPPYGSSLHSSSRASQLYAENGYVSHDSRSLPSGSGSSVSAQWQLRGSSAPDSPNYNSLPSPTGSSGYPYTDSDDAPSPSSSASSHQHSYSHHDSHSALSYDYYPNQSPTQHLSSTNYSLSRQSPTYNAVEVASTRGTTPQYSYTSSNTISPTASQPPSPTYTTSPIVAGTGYHDGRSVATTFIPQDASSIQSSYSNNSLTLAGCSPTEAQPARVHVLPSPTGEAAAPLLQRHVPLSVYDHSTSSHAKYGSAISTAQTTTQGDHGVRSDDGRQSMRRAMPYTAVEPAHSHQATVVHDNRTHARNDYDTDRAPVQELFGHLQQPHQPHAQTGNAHISYGYSYSALSAEHQQAWRADALRSRATLVH